MNYYVANQKGYPIEYGEELEDCIEYIVQACVKNRNHMYLRNFKICESSTNLVLFNFKECYKIDKPLNPMCKDCKKLNNGCNGSYNQVYSGCIYKK